MHSDSRLHQLLKDRPVRIRAALILAGALVLAAPAAAQAFTVYGAASLSAALPRIDSSPRYNFAGSNPIQPPNEAGAPPAPLQLRRLEPAPAPDRARRARRPVRVRGPGRGAGAVPRGQVLAARHV